ncbi:MAG: hypothetical protein Q7T55_00635, partial [Solirubrobacteraceae bacterium]|nr:hypothetical protein [Solirubrobacteraceae bacterium]
MGLIDWKKFEQKMAGKQKIAKKSREIKILEKVLAWKKRGKSRRITLVELSKKCRKSYRALLEIVKTAQK